MRASANVLMVTAAALLLSGCVTPPMGPSIGAMPGQGKSFDTFERDQYECEGYAYRQVEGEADAANRRAVGTAVVGAALGAAIGAAAGGGRRVGTGAAIGGTVGTVAGANRSAYAQHGIQRRYDIAYAQCMSSKGHRVPGYGGPPPGYGPQEGYPPPPPPGY